MPEIDPELIRSATCRRAFRLMMWGFLFLMPQLVPVQQVWPILPLLAGWALVFAGLSWVRGLHPSADRLRLLAAVAFFLGVSRAAVAALSGDLSKTEGAILYALFAVSVLVAVCFVHGLCRLVGAMAAHAGSKAVAKDAAYRPWLYLIAAFLPCLQLALPDEGGWLAAGVVVVVLFCIAVVASLMMGLMASTTRMCAQLAATVAQPSATAAQPPAAAPDDADPA